MISVLRKVEQLVLILLVLGSTFSSMVTILSAEASVTGVKIGLVTYDGTAGDPDTQEKSDRATYNYLVGKGYDVTVIHQWALDSGNPTYYKRSSDWQVFDLVIMPGAIYSGWNMTELVKSKIPVITMNAGYADELELASGYTMHSLISEFNVVDNDHYITRQLSLGTLSFASPMYTDASDNTGFNSTVLVDSGVSTQGILIVHNMKKYVYFGWYTTDMMSSEGWDLLERTIHWTLITRGTAFSWTVTAVGIEVWTDNGEEKTTPVNGTQSGRGTVSPYKDYIGWYSIGLKPQNDGRIRKESVGVSVESDGKVNVMISIVSIEYYDKIAVISGEVRGITEVETTDENGNEMKNQLLPHQTVYIMGGGFEPLTTYPLYVVNDTDWIHEMPIPERVDGTETNITTDWNGKITTEIDGWTFPRGTAWTWPLKPGAYDIVIDVNRNGIFDKGIDALDYYQTAGFIVEEPLKIKRLMFEYNVRFTDQSFPTELWAATTDMWNGHYDVLYRAEAIRQIRPDYIATVYRNIKTIWKPEHPEYNETEYNLFINNRWILKNASGDLISNEGGMGLMVDVGSKGYHKWLANWFKNYCDTYGINGAFLDNFFPCSLAWHDTGGIHPINPRTNEPWTDEEFKQAMIDLSIEVKNTIAPKLVLANTILHGERFWLSEFKQYFMDALRNSKIDGILCEMPWSEGTSSNWYDEDKWLYTLNYLVWLEDNFLSRDKILMLVSENAGLIFPANLQFGSTLLPLGVSKEQYVTYCFASTLLFAKSNKIYQTFGYYTPEDYPQSLFQIELGNPLGVHYVVPGTHVYARDFSKVKVLVNPTNDSYSVTLNGNYQTIAGESVTSPISVSPHTGLILIVTPPTIESCDSTGAPKSAFSLVDTVYVNGSGYPVSPLLEIYIVADTTWSDGVPIPPRVPGTVTHISSDSNGKIPPTAIWNGPLVPGKYDIAIDVNQNGKFDAGIDALLCNKVEVTAGFFVIPELHLGTVTTLLLLLMLAALVLFQRRSLMRIKT